MELMKAHNQWRIRPKDERFKTVSDLHESCTTYRNLSVGAEIPFEKLHVEPVYLDHETSDLNLIGPSGKMAKLTHWSMGQLCTQASAPAAYLRTLPADLAARNINHGLAQRPDRNKTSQLLFGKSFASETSLTLRAAVSESYSRIWNNDVTKRIKDLQDHNPNWVNPMAYEIKSPGKNGGWPEMTGAMVPSGLYASDHDMFAFLVDESKTFDGSPEGIKRGFFVWNSEVGAKSFGIMTFLYDQVCGNNIVWGAKNVLEMKIRHVGNADMKAFHQLSYDLKRYSESSTGEIETTIKRARMRVLGQNPAEILDSVFQLSTKIKEPLLTRSRLQDAISLAEVREERYGDPRSLWAIVGGLTEASQFIPHADERNKIDKAAGKLLSTIEF